MVVDAMRVAFTSGHIDAFVLLSGDSDLLPLVQELIRMGKRVDVVAVAGSASAALAANCHQFDTYEDLLSVAPEEGEPLAGGQDAGTGSGAGDGTAPALDQALAFLRQSVLELQDRGSNTLDSTVYDYLRLLNPAFSVRALGFRRWRDFLERAAELGIVVVEPRGSNMVLIPAPTAPAASSAARRTRLGRIRRPLT
jgi:hypothetical protein